MKPMLTTIAAMMLAVPLGLGGAVHAQQPGPQGRGPDFLLRGAAAERATGLSHMLDADRDGAVSRAEVDAWAAGKAVPPAILESMFADADTNRDGRITLAEQQADALRSFDEADTDHDGRMTGAERAAAEARFSAQEPGTGVAPAPLPVPTRKR
ncbi:EF-hand domain-containing protein [Sphingomonas montana]|uniref:EF-hand domain-containing protein n=1 Tax=Sphingomonas montana TaxID=1843236 RepID=UPI00096E6C25|nr:EF-hand domain-containing protein [Sphingomonas montana]